MKREPDWDNIFRLMFFILSAVLLLYLGYLLALVFPPYETWLSASADAPPD